MLRITGLLKFCQKIYSEIKTPDSKTFSKRFLAKGGIPLLHLIKFSFFI